MGATVPVVVAIIASFKIRQPRAIKHMALPSFLFPTSATKANTSRASSITGDVVFNVKRLRRRISSAEDRVPTTPPPYPTRHQF
ncbi:hypothetical protein H310_05067 [Aphanomyces invadans]|uniref:Uncharacterized protein n=1 Tax=Aphanomyces invadans TaxID=157072 RepID=A0A024UBU9_9STRA|nr:hypothetical protein H310_05067 [Aphanomyces invadans]ETW03680.1 hypothetical protein H310_05067 [Aphanomyces invadans]|eukprot:XP_008867909.1 hypothetical protein H310_05067 [Aphanomyces invadans]